MTRATRKALAVGSASSLLGTLLMLGSFYLFLRIAERWSGARLATDSLAGIWQNTPLSVLISALGGFLFAWFAFGFIITYSQLSSRDEIRDLGQRDRDLPR